MAGFSMADADDLRKAMGKKIPAVMRRQLDRFIDGCVANGYEEKLAHDLFGFIEHFAGYGFNRSHSAAYAYVAYQTAWLKAHHPAEYMAALLTASKRDKDRTALYLNECRTMGLRVLVPDVNRSDSDFATVDGEITFGLSAIRNVGETVVEHILDEREKNGYVPLVPGLHRPGRCRRAQPAGHRRPGEGGGVRQLSATRGEGLLEHLDGGGGAHRRATAGRGHGTVLAVRRQPVGGAAGAGGGPRPPLGQAGRLGFEKEMLGLYVSDHPLFGVERALKAMCTSTIPGLWDLEDKAEATVGGIVGPVTRRYTKKGEPILFFALEDLEGSTEVIAFPRTVEKAGPLVREDAVVVVSGRVDHRGDEVKFIAGDIREPRLEAEETVRLRVAAVELSRSVVDQLKQVLANHPGIGDRLPPHGLRRRREGHAARGRPQGRSAVLALRRSARPARRRRRGLSRVSRTGPRPGRGRRR